MAAFVSAWAALGTASTSTTTATAFATTLTSAFAAVFTGLVSTLLVGCRCVCGSGLIADFGCTLSIVATVAIARWAIATVTTVVALWTFTARRALGALLVAASVLCASGLQTHVCALWLAFSIKTFAAALILTL